MGAMVAAMTEAESAWYCEFRDTKVTWYGQSAALPEGAQQGDVAQMDYGYFIYDVECGWVPVLDYK